MLSLGKFEKGLIDEIATLSGYPEIAVREILELTFLRQLEFVMNRKDIRIPFIGNLTTVYHGDEFEAGNRVAIVTCTVNPSELYRRIIGDIEDGESDIIKDFLNSKAEAEIQQALEK